MQELQLGYILECLAAFMVVKGPNADILCAMIMIVGSKDGRRRADIVHQGHGKERLRVGTGGEVHAVEITQRPEDRVDLVALYLAEAYDFLVRVGIDDLGGAALMAEEGDIRHGDLYGVVQHQRR